MISIHIPGGNMTRSGEMAEQFRAEDPGLIPITHRVGHNCL